MAPKSSASSAGGGGGKAVKKDNPGGTKEKHKPKFVRWKGCPPTVCKSCEQSTDQLDRDCPEGQEDFLYWVQCRTSSKINKGKPYPSGEECYSCYFIRRKIFNAIKATKLAETRKENLRVTLAFGSSAADMFEVSLLQVIPNPTTWMMPTLAPLPRETSHRKPKPQRLTSLLRSGSSLEASSPSRSLPRGDALSTSPLRT